MDKGKQIVTDKSNAGASGSSNRKMRALIDRSKLRILLCDTNASSCKEVASLLRECSYQGIAYCFYLPSLHTCCFFSSIIYVFACMQRLLLIFVHLLLPIVISVGSTGEAIHVLSSEGPTIDIVLAELDLPMANCLKMLKYITEDQELQRIPVISKITPAE